MLSIVNNNLILCEDNVLKTAKEAVERMKNYKPVSIEEVVNLAKIFSAMGESEYGPDYGKKNVVEPKIIL